MQQMHRNNTTTQQHCGHTLKGGGAGVDQSKCMSVCTWLGGVHVTRGRARLPEAPTMARAVAMRTDSDPLVTLTSARERGERSTPGGLPGGRRTTRASLQRRPEQKESDPTTRAGLRLWFCSLSWSPAAPSTSENLTLSSQYLFLSFLLTGGQSTSQHPLTFTRSFIHSFTSRRQRQPRRATAGGSAAVRVRRRLAQGHLLLLLLHTQLGGGGGGGGGVSLRDTSSSSTLS